MSNEFPPAGWYPNPDGTPSVRWFSGVGWTEYTRESPVTPARDQADQAQTQQLADPEPTAEIVPAETAAWDQSDAEVPPADTTAWDQSAQPVTETPANPWAQPAPTYGQPAPAYGAYQPPPQQPLTGAGMRHLGAMFADIGRIVRRGWLPILGISLAIWAAVSLVYIAAFMGTVDVSALQRAFDLIGSATSSETGLPANDAEVAAAFRDAFAALSPGGWALLATVLTLLMLVASALQTAAVSRVAMDAAAGRPVTWGAGWKSGFTAGWRLLGYYILLSLIAGVVWSVAVIVVIGLWALSPALSVVVGILGFLVLMVLTFWLSGRLIPVIAQVVLGRHAIAWSWRHTKGKFWAVLGRYLLWSIAASVIVNIIVSVISIPASLLLLGSASSTSSTTQLGASMVLSLITMPITMALSAVTFIGVVPIWRDLTDDPAYRSIDESGQPITIR